MGDAAFATAIGTAIATGAATIASAITSRQSISELTEKVKTLVARLDSSEFAQRADLARLLSRVEDLEERAATEDRQAVKEERYQERREFAALAEELRSALAGRKK